MEQFSSHGSTLRVDLTPEGSDRVLDGDLLELRAHVATREVVYLSVAEVNALIADLEHKLEKLSMAVAKSDTTELNAKIGNLNDKIEKLSTNIEKLAAYVE